MDTNLSFDCAYGSTVFILIFMFLADYHDVPASGLQSERVRQVRHAGSTTPSDYREAPLRSAVIRPLLCRTRRTGVCRRRPAEPAGI